MSTSLSLAWISTSSQAVPIITKQEAERHEHTQVAASL